MYGTIKISYKNGVIDMYNKKYIIESIEEFNGHNPIYEGVLGRIAYPAYFNTGERGWFLWIEEGWLRELAHRIHTSVIQRIEYLDHMIIVETENTRFVFIEK